MRKSSLPTNLVSLVGRDDVLQRASEILGSRRLLTLHGPGGVGKTRLALELVRHHPDAYLVELAAAPDGASVDSAAAAAFELGDEPGSAPARRIAERLRGQQARLVIDNCEHVLEAVAELVEALLEASGDLRIIATSQEPLGLPEEAVLRVPPLSPGEAERLFCERAQQRDPEFRLSRDDQVTVTELCARLDGIPLAIELAAAKAGTLRLSDLLASLEDRFAILRGPARSRPTRQHTLEAAVSWSYGLLASDERQVFNRTAILPGPFTHPTAKAVATGPGVEARQVPHLLGRLVERAVLDFGAGGYRMAQSLRAYGHERLLESGELADVAVRAAREAAGRGSHRVALLLAQEAAAALGPESPERLDVLDLVAAQGERAGQYGAAVEALERLLDAPELRSHPARLAQREMQLCSAVSLATGDLEAAAAVGRRALARLRDLGDSSAVLAVENELTWLRALGGDLETQVREAASIVERARGKPEEPAYLHALGSLGCGCLYSGRFAAARDALLTGLRLAESRSDMYQAGWFTGMLGMALLLTEGPSAALQRLGELRTRNEQLLDPVFVEATLLAQLMAGNAEAVLAELERDRDPIAGFGVRAAFILGLGALAATELGRAGLAAQLKARSQALFKEQEIYFQGRARWWLEGLAAWASGDLDSAIELLARAVSRLSEMGVPPFEALALRDLADAYRLAGRRADAAASEARLNALLDSLDAPLYRALRRYGEAEGSVELGRMGFLALRARSLAAEYRLDEAAVAFDELGLAWRRDATLNLLARSGRSAGSPLARRLARMVLFDGVPVEDLEELAAQAVLTRFAAGELILRRFDEARTLWVVDLGRVRLTVVQPHGEVVVADLGPGELFSERALLETEASVTDATALEDSELIQLAPRPLLRFVESRPAVGERLLTLARRSFRLEASATGDPEPKDVLSRVLARIQRLSAADGRRPPAFEILPVYLGPAGIQLLQPAGEKSWRATAQAAVEPGQLVDANLEAAGLKAELVHSTSWRYEQGQLIVTYLAVLPDEVVRPGLRELPVLRTGLARGGTHGPPASIGIGQVVEHALRHLSWLSRDDPVIRAALTDAWLQLLETYQPEPFRAL